MVSDSAITDENNKSIGSIAKIFRLEYGHLYASCGDGDDRDLRRLIHNVKTPDELPLCAELKKIDGDIEAIVAFKSGELWDICTGEAACAFPVDDAHFVIGSGRQLATGALDAFDKIASDWTLEKKIKTAVMIACDRDVYSHGPLQIVRL